MQPEQDNNPDSLNDIETSVVSNGCQECGGAWTDLIFKVEYFSNLDNITLFGMKCCGDHSSVFQINSRNYVSTTAV